MRDMVWVLLTIAHSIVTGMMWNDYLTYPATHPIFIPIVATIAMVMMLAKCILRTTGRRPE